MQVTVLDSSRQQREKCEPLNRGLRAAGGQYGSETPRVADNLRPEALPCRGLRSQADRLDWMYQGGMVGMQEANKRAEEQLLGVRPVELAEPAEPSKARACMARRVLLLLVDRNSEPGAA